MNETERQPTTLLEAAKKVLRLRTEHRDDWDSCPLCKSMQYWHIELYEGVMCPLEDLRLAVEAVESVEAST